jgi:hypothetical protein
LLEIPGRTIGTDEITQRATTLRNRRGQDALYRGRQSLVTTE